MYITVHPLLSPLGAYSFQTHLRGSLIETGGLFNLEKTKVSVLHKKTRIQSGKAQVWQVGGHAAKDQKQIWTSSWWINHPR